MNIIFRLVFEIIRLTLRFVFWTFSMLIGCFVRLLYWSVRTYGWGQVVGVIGALILGDLIYFDLFPKLWHNVRWFSPKPMLIGIPSLAIIVWGIGRMIVWGSQEALQALTSRSRENHIPETIEQRQIERTEQVVTRTPSGQIWDQVVNWDNMMRAWQRVEVNGGSAGPDKVTLEAFMMDWENLLRRLHNELTTGMYRPQNPRMVEVPKASGGVRSLAIFNVRDRIVQQSINHVLLPMWDSRFAPCSYAYRPGRSAHQAIVAVEKAVKNGRPWIVDADIESFFDSLTHQRLMQVIGSWLDDESVRSLITLILTTSGSNGLGLSQGSPLSPLLSNLYLHSFDEALLQRSYAVHRYADDFVILCPTREQANEALQTSQRLLRTLQLRLNEQKTHIINISDGFTFLGFTFTSDGKRPSDNAVRSIDERLQNVSDPTKRQQIENGWKAYFGESPQRFDIRKEEKGKMQYSDDDNDETDDFSWLNDTVKNESTLVDSDWGIYQRRFIGRSGLFARYWRNSKGQSGYVPVRQQISITDFKAHLSGQDILGTYILDQSSKIKSLVFDIDGPTMDESGRQKAHQLAMAMAKELNEQNIPTLLFDSGGKGRHIWLCFGEPVDTKPVRQWAESFLDKYRPFTDGILVEIFPKQDFLSDGAYGSMIRLPLGKHPESNRFSRLLDPNGNEVDDPWVILRNNPFVDVKLLNQSRTINAVNPPESVMPMINGCALLKGLINKALKLHQLKHTERLALLYTLGHCGDAGRNYIHQIMAMCGNYDPRTTERFIVRLEPGHKSIRCSRLREWLKDYLPDVECSCQRGKNPSPIDLILPNKKAEVRSASKSMSDQDWKSVSDDLFNHDE